MKHTHGPLCFVLERGPQFQADTAWQGRCFSRPFGVMTRGRTGRLPVGLAVFERWERSEFNNYFIQGFVVRVLGVARIARVIAVGVAHHVTQRGVGRRFLLESEAGN